MLKDTSHFLFCQLQCNWIYVEVFDPLGLEFCAGQQIRIWLYSSTCHPPIMPAPCIEDTFLFPLYIFGFLVKSQLFIGMWIYIRVFYLISLICVSALMPIPKTEESINLKTHWYHSWVYTQRKLSWYIICVLINRASLKIRMLNSHSSQPYRPGSDGCAYLTFNPSSHTN